MKIAIEARMMGPENTRGLGRYIQELATAMASIAPEHEFNLIVRNPDHPLANFPNVRTVIADVPWYSLQEQRIMPKVLRGIGADVVHIPHWNVPLAYSGPLVVTIHDLLLRHQPASAQASTRAWPIRLIKKVGFRLVIDHAVRAARKICVPTEFVRKDLEHLYPKTMGKVVVTGEGISQLTTLKSRPGNDDSGHGPIRRTLEDDQDVKDVSGVRNVGRFLLYVGSAYPHKRLDLLLQVWQEASRLWPDMELVLAGKEDVFVQRIKESAARQNIQRVRFLGQVSDDRLADLYQDALALVFPSSFEGFGLPPLEALAHGCPVVSSDAGPMPEVLGKKGVIYFKSGSRDGMLQAIKTVVDNQSEFQNQAIQAGPELAAKHSWQQAAAKTLQAYQSAVLG